VVTYSEKCLSIPKSFKHPTTTVRHTRIVVQTDNLGTVEFKSTTESGAWKSQEDFLNDEGLLECVCAQHEIDHLDGILMTDRKYSSTVVNTQPKYGRNERVLVKLNNGTTEYMKFKKVMLLAHQGVHCEII